MDSRKTTAAAPMPRLDGQVCFALYSTGLAMNKIYRRLLQPLGITYPQYLVLLVLWEHDPQIVSEIGERLFLDSATLTPLLKRLETAGLIRRSRSTQDERRVEVSLTDKGRRLQQAAPEIQQAIFRATQCSVGELAHLWTGLRDLRDRLLHQS